MSHQLASGIGHPSCVFARRPGMGVMSISIGGLRRVSLGLGHDFIDTRNDLRSPLDRLR